MNSIIQKLSLIAIIPLLILTFYFKSKIDMPYLKISKEEASFTLNSKLLYYFSLGNKRLISSYLWCYTLLESDLEHYKKNDGNSWMFNRFNTISELDPKFYENYLFGGQYLSIIKDDVLGAEIIYNKGLRYYPNDIWLNYNAGFNYFFELNDNINSYKLFSRIMYHPIATKHLSFLPSLAAKIKAHESGPSESYKLIVTAMQNTQSKQLKEKYQKSLYALKAEMDLKCLNTKNINCNSLDYFGDDYLYENGKFKAKRKWKKFRPSKRSLIKKKRD